MRSAPEMPVLSLLRTLSSQAAAGWRAVRGLPPIRRVRALVKLAAEAGTQGYPPDTRRRLKILNMIAYLIAITTLIYAIQQSVQDFHTYAPMILLNLVLVVTVLLVPFAHRFNAIAGGLLIVGAEYTALLGFGDFFSRDGGAQLQYIIAAAACFVIFDLKRIRLIAFLVALALVLHLCVWFWFPAAGRVGPGEQAVADSLYLQGAVTTFVLIAASVWYAFSLVERAKAETDAVLRNVLPDAIVERLKAKPGVAIADSIDQASVMFADISGFVALTLRLGADKTVELLSRIVTEFDALAVRHGVEKIKTIGDAYMVVAGLPDPVPDHTARLARMALDMLDYIARLRADTGLALSIRVGLASGKVTAGVIGTKKFSYDVWGEPVNLASRLEGQAAPGRVLVCPTSHAQLVDTFEFEPRGPIDIKGIGSQETWYLICERPPPGASGQNETVIPSDRLRTRNAS
ncbi:MAG: adenylate/guanylate cyclase domain-containing protein [Hyphomicrobium sp.]